MPRPLLLLAAVAALLAPRAGAQGMATAADPAYGTLRPTAEAARLDVVARRADEPPDALLDDGCTGFVDRSAPDAVVEWGGGDLRVWAEAAFDPTLLVALPDGSWACDDDGGPGNLPAVTLSGATAGRYAVWLGTYSPEAESDAATLYAGTPPPPPVLDASAAPRAGRIAATGGFEDAAGPIERAVQAGGRDEAAAFERPDEFAFCTGYIDAAAPTVVVDYVADGGTGTLALGATSLEEDLVLVVSGPDGAVLCNDDFDGTDPVVAIDDAASGAYAVWAGTFRLADGPVDATVIVAEAAPEVIDDFDYDFGGGPYSEGTYTALDLDTVPGPRAAADDAGGSTVAVAVAPTAGNPVQGMACNGFVEPAATAAVTLAGEGPFALTATGDGDLTLTVRTPSGGWFCSDDADGLDPGIQIDDAEDGLYLVWVGTFTDDGSTSEATLSAAPGEVVFEGFEYPDDEFERTTQSEGAYDGDALSTGPATHTAGLEGTVAYTQAVTAGGPVLNPVEGEVCAGFLPAAPTAALTVAEAGALSVSVTADDDLTLVVRAGGAWTCSDDADGSDPAVSLDVEPGTVEVWVGTFSRRDAPVPATLTVGR